MLRTSCSFCSFGVVVFIPTVFSGLCWLFSFPVQSLGPSLLGFLLFCFFLFCAFGCFRFACPASYSFPWGLFPSSSSFAPLIRHPLRFPICLGFSPLLVVSPPPPPPAFVLDVLGFILFLGLLLLWFRPWLSLFFHPFVSVPCFPHAAAADFSLPQHFRLLLLLLFFLVFVPVFPHTATPAAPFVFGAAPAFFLADGSQVAVP